MVRKSIVLNSRSMAGGPQIFAPTARYARNNFGILSLAFSACHQGHCEGWLRRGSQMRIRQVFAHGLIDGRTVRRVLRG